MTPNRAARRALRFHRRVIALSADGAALPTEFRLFTPGWNETENGKFLFDEEAAKSVMAAYEAWGVDLAIDLEHQMLNAPDGAADPTARDARGWCCLELRSGELWACDVRWTPDGAARLSEKRQRYISPAFEADPESKRILKMANIALTAMPATHDTPALVAASARTATRRRITMAMSADHVKAAIAAMKDGDGDKALATLEAMLSEAAGGDADGAEGDGAEGTAPPKKAEEKVEDPKVVDAGEEGAAADEADEEKPEKKTERKAMRAMLRHLTGEKTFAAALGKVDEFRKSHLALEAERVQLAKQRAVLESAERRKLVGELVKMGAEFPSTVWADDKATTVKPRWAKMPIEELRSHVADQAAARGVKAGDSKPGVKPPAGQVAGEGEKSFKVRGGHTVTLSAAQLRVCEQSKCDPQDFAELQAFRDSNKKGNAQ